MNIHPCSSEDTGNLSYNLLKSVYLFLNTS